MAEYENSGHSSSGKGLPRKLTAVGTVGEQNQLFTVYEKNWNCTDCGQENYPARYLPVHMQLTIEYFLKDLFQFSVQTPML